MLYVHMFVRADSVLTFICFGVLFIGCVKNVYSYTHFPQILVIFFKREVENLKYHQILVGVCLP